MFINVFLADISSLLQNRQKFDRIYSTLPDYRKAKIDRLRFYEDKCLSLGVGFLLQKSVSELGYGEFDGKIVQNEYGKPHFSNYPNLHFNLSHSEKLVMCALSDTNIGCDIQFIDKKSDYPIKKMLTQSEFEEISNSKDQISTFFELWTLKESFLKCIGEGFSASFENISVSLKNGITQNASDSRFSAFKIGVPSDYKCCCVAENYIGDAPKVTFLQI